MTARITAGGTWPAERPGGRTAGLRGITWDHPRGYRALDALADRRATRGTTPPLTWDRQPLADFEAKPMRELARAYDLLIIDHPGLGEATADGALLAIDDLVEPITLADWRRRTVGASFASYALSGQWAVPIDAAAQVGVLSAALFDTRRGRAPALWADSLALAATVPTTLCLGGPHALLMFQAVCCALAPARPGVADAPWLDDEVGVAALELMAALLAVANPELSAYDPIGVLDAMAAGRVAYCPLVYGYRTYQGVQTSQRAELRAVDAPTGVPGGRPGSVLGGTGIAVSASCTDPAAAVGVISELLAPDVQGGFLAANGGQGATTECWSDPEIDLAAGGFYSSTLRTVQQAWVRPRFAGYVPFQRDASALIRDGLFDRAPAAVVLDQVYRRFDHAGAST